MYKILTKRIIEDTYSMASIIEKIEDAYVQYQSGNGEFPERYFMPTEEGGDLLVGSSYLRDSGYYSTISSAYMPRNAGTDMALVNGVIVLFEATHGQIVATLDEPAITKLRTGAKTAVAVKHLARPDAQTLGIIGMGDQAISHIEAITCVHDITQVYVWSRSPEKHPELIPFVQEKLGVTIDVLESPNAVAECSDVLVHATWSKTPLVTTQSIKPGTFVVGLFHDPSAVEYDAELLGKSDVFVDTSAGLHAGTVANAITSGAIQKEDVTELGVVVTSQLEPMQNDGYRYFQSTGHGIENLAASISLYEGSL